MASLMVTLRPDDKGIVGLLGNIIATVLDVPETEFGC